MKNILSDFKSTNRERAKEQLNKQEFSLTKKTIKLFLGLRAKHSFQLKTSTKNVLINNINNCIFPSSLFWEFESVDLFYQCHSEIYAWQSFCLPIFSNATRTSCPVTTDCSLAGAFRLRPTALFPEVLKKETLPHNRNVFLDMTLNFFSPSSGKHKSVSDIDKTSPLCN